MRSTTNKELRSTNSTLKAMIHTVEEYAKWIKLETKKDEQEMSIYQVGKLNPKNELMKNIEEITKTAIVDSLNVGIKHDAL